MSDDPRDTLDGKTVTVNACQVTIQTDADAEAFADIVAAAMRRMVRQPQPPAGRDGE